MTRGLAISRRSLLAEVAVTGGALMLGFEIPFGRQRSWAANGAAEITAWIVIEPDDTVIIRVAKSEMGQGVLTALPLLVAEELECDWDKVKAEYARPHDNFRRNRVWGDMSTGGSRSVRHSHEFLRTAGATARHMLVAAAAAHWDVAASECRAENSIITHLPSRRTVSFGNVAAAAAKIAPPSNVALKHPRDWKLAGRPHRRLDVIDKIKGKPLYGIDVRLPDMVYAAVIQAPVFAGRLTAVDDSKVREMRGIRKVVKLDDAVAVVADNWWRAKNALEALDISWDDRGNGAVSSDSIRGLLRSGLTAGDAGVGREHGDVTLGLAQAASRIEAEYEVPFLSHATMEPQNCTAWITRAADGVERVEIWAPTQNGEASLLAAARAAGVSPRNVAVHKCMLGGGFGRRGMPQDFVTLAVRIAKDIGQPVKVLWTREEDMRHDFYRPAATARMTAGLDASGMPVAWHVRMSGTSILGMIRPAAVDRHSQEGFLEDMPYDIPNYRVEFAVRSTHVPVGFWRCVNHTQNCFFKECFIDELAHASAQDPYRYRRRMLSSHPRADRFLAVLDAAAAHAGWERPARAGVYRGIALNEVSGTFTAAVVEVSVEAELTIHRVISAIDCGIAVNPLTVETQVEGATADALSAALYGEITIKAGGAEQSNFHDYRLLRLAEMPRVETVILSGGDGWGGVGEPPVAVVAPALCNAIFAATGKRIRSLPLKRLALRKT